jgi:hypothetical protein
MTGNLPFIGGQKPNHLLPNSEFQPAPVFQALAFRADRWSA